MEPTLITQPPGFPEERPETDDIDGMLDHLAEELEGKQFLEKPRVSKKVMVFTLKEQNRIISQLRKEVNSNFMLLDDRSRKTQNIVQTLVGKIKDQEEELAQARGEMTAMQGDMVTMAEKVEEALKLADVAKALEQQINSLHARVEAHTASLQNHERRFDDLTRLNGRVGVLEEEMKRISGDQVFVPIDDMGEPLPLSQVVKGMNVTLAEYNERMVDHSKTLRQQSEVISKSEASLASGIRNNRETIEEIQIKLAKNDDIDLGVIRRGQVTIAEQMDVIQQELLEKIDKAYVDEHVEARYEEIINHLHQALSSTEEDEQDFKYAPWCYWCQQLAPTWEAFAEEAERSLPQLKVVKVDCVVEKELCGKQVLKAFPTIRFFRNGNAEPSDYRKDRSVQAFLEYSAAIIGEDTQVLKRYRRVVQDYPGCQLSGFIMVNRVPGNFHIEAHSKHHNINPPMTNVSHVVRSLSFGAQYPTRTQSLKAIPMEGIPSMEDRVFITDKLHSAPHHYIKVVSTFTEKGKHKKGVSDNLQYQMIVSSQIVPYEEAAIPEAKFSYDLSPMSVNIKERRRKWYDFVTSVMAIVGGTFTVVGVLDNILFRVLKQKKM